MYRRYVTVHGIITGLGFSVAATWIIWSAIGHSNAQQRCITDFFLGSDTQEADTLCNIFPWVTVGIMGALWLILAVVQVCDCRYARPSNLQIDSSTFSSFFRHTEKTNVAITTNMTG